MRQCGKQYCVQNAHIKIKYFYQIQLKKVFVIQINSLKKWK